LTKVRPGSLAVLVISLPIVAGFFFYGPFVLDLFLHRRPPTRFRIPEGYVGWVRIQYGVATAPPLTREGKYWVIAIGSDGKAQTSGQPPEGWASDQFFYQSGSQLRTLSNAGWCKGGMIWGEEIERDRSSAMVETFYVGSEDQFRTQVDPQDRLYSPCG
jgi:hypothetical protein